MKILAFAGSNSSTSINRQLVTYASKFFDNHELEIIDLNNFEMPIYSSDREKEYGIPKLAYDFAEKVDRADFLMVSLSEHNGAYSVAFKNIYDWISRVPGRKAFGEKQMFLMATSPGKKGGETILEIASKRFPFDGANIAETFSLPFFYEFFDAEKGVVNADKSKELNEKVAKLKSEFLK